jgi:hypothetical protein
MEHLEEHPHAFINENNIVISVLVFSNHDTQLLTDVKELLNASDSICCCDNGLANINWIWDNGTWVIPTK